MPSATNFLSAATKSRQKRPLSNAEGLAQRKSLLWKYHLRWPSQSDCHKNVCCETDSRAVQWLESIKMLMAYSFDLCTPLKKE